MPKHSFQVRYEGVYYYPTVEVITHTTLRVHFYGDVSALGLPQTFIIDITEKGIIGKRITNEKSLACLDNLREQVVKHLQEIKAI